MRERAAVAAVDQPFADVTSCGGNQLRYRYRVGTDNFVGIVWVPFAEGIDHIRQLGVLWLDVDVHDLPERRRLWRMGLRIEIGEIEFGEISRDVPKPAGAKPTPELVPIIQRKVFFGIVRPRHVMATVAGRQVDAVRLVIGGEDEAEHVGHVVLGNIFLVDAQHVWRSGGICLGEIVEFEAVDLTEVALFVDPQHDGLGERVDASEEVSRFDLLEIAAAGRLLHRLEHRVLADALRPPSTSAWLILSPGYCTRCASHLMMWLASSG